MRFGQINSPDLDPSAAAVRDALETLTEGDRLDASAIQNLPSGGGVITSLGRTSGTGTSAIAENVICCSLSIPGGTVQVGDEIEIMGFIVPGSGNTGNCASRININSTVIFRQSAGVSVSEIARKILFVNSTTETYGFGGVFSGAYSSEGIVTLNIDWSATVTIDFVAELNAANDSFTYPLARAILIRH